MKNPNSPHSHPRARRVALVAGLVFLAAPALGCQASEQAETPPEAQSTITPAAAADHVGSRQTVCGRVVQAVHTADMEGQPTYLNFGGLWPDQVFGVVIQGEHRGRFAEPPEQAYLNKQICVTGTVGLSEGKPQMVIEDPAAISVQGAS